MALAPAERAAYLDLACRGDPELRREVEGMLAADAESRRTGPTTHLGAAIGRTAASLSHHAVPPEQFGPYRLLERLGEGGMGTVYRAQQTRPVHRQVALKITHGGALSESLRIRFEAERQTLARMSHPGIAQVYDAGEVDGVPFFSMELVPGQPISDHCRQRGLDLEARIALFLQICEAVQHAHLRGILHRDLKPSNLLVDPEGHPKIIDFGIAKPVGGEADTGPHLTQTGALLGTPRYMSPEQVDPACRDLDLRSDVYSLGVVFYELITGAHPLDPLLSSLSDPADVRLLIREAEPRRPSRVPGLPTRRARRLRGDLDWILLRALERNRERRYPSVEAFASDLRRFLEGQPILARPPSTLYQAKKLLARNPLAAALSGTLVLLALGGGGLLVLQNRHVRAERDHAASEAATAREVSEFLQNLFRVSDPRVSRGQEPSARELLDAGAERVSSDLSDQPLVQARLMILLGNIYRNLGYMEQSRSLLTRGIKVARLVSEERPEVLAEGMLGLAWLQRGTGRLEEGLAAAQEAVTYAEEALGPDSPVLAELVTVQGVLFRDLDRAEPARKALERAAALAERLHGPDSRLRGTALYHRAWLEHQQKHDKLALALQEEACAILSQALGEDRTEVAWCYNDQSVVLAALGRSAEAARLLRQAIHIWEKVLPADHPDIAAGVNNLASQLFRSGRHEEALEQFHRALSMRRQALGPEHPDVGTALCNLAYAEQEMGWFSRSEEHLRQGLAILQDGLDADHGRVVRNLYGLVDLYLEWGHSQDALAIAEEIVDIRERTRGPDGVWHIGALRLRARVLSRLGRYRQAEHDLRRALEMASAVHPPEHPGRSMLVVEVAACLMAQDRHDEARAELVELRSALESAGARNPALAEVSFHLARVERVRGNDASAGTALAAALELRREIDSPDDPARLYVEAVSLAAEGDRAGAMQQLGLALEAGFPVADVEPALDFPDLRTAPELDVLLAEFAPEDLSPPDP